MSNVLRVRTEPGGEWTEIPSIQGPQGEDGFSPTVTTTPIDGGTKVTITDAEGPHEFNVMDGSGGASTASDVSFDDTDVGLGAGNPNAPIDTVQKAIAALAEDDIGSEQVQDMIDNTTNDLFYHIPINFIDKNISQSNVSNKDDFLLAVGKIPQTFLAIKNVDMYRITLTRADITTIEDNLGLASWQTIYFYTYDYSTKEFNTTLIELKPCEIASGETWGFISSTRFIKVLNGDRTFYSSNEITSALIAYIKKKYNISGGISEATVDQKIADAIAAITDFTEVSF